MPKTRSGSIAKPTLTHRSELGRERKRKREREERERERDTRTQTRHRKTKSDPNAHSTQLARCRASTARTEQNRTNQRNKTKTLSHWSSSTARTWQCASMPPAAALPRHAAAATLQRRTWCCDATARRHHRDLPVTHHPSTRVRVRRYPLVRNHRDARHQPYRDAADSRRRSRHGGMMHTRRLPHQALRTRRQRRRRRWMLSHSRRLHVPQSPACDRHGHCEIVVATGSSSSQRATSTPHALR